MHGRSGRSGCRRGRPPRASATRGMPVNRPRLRSIVFDCSKPAAQARFWAAALGYHVRPYDAAAIARRRAAGYAVEDDPSGGDRSAGRGADYLVQPGSRAEGGQEPRPSRPQHRQPGGGGRADRPRCAGPCALPAWCRAGSSCSGARHCLREQRGVQEQCASRLPSTCAALSIARSAADRARYCSRWTPSGSTRASWCGAGSGRAPPRPGPPARMPASPRTARSRSPTCPRQPGAGAGASRRRCARGRLPCATVEQIYVLNGVPPHRCAPPDGAAQRRSLAGACPGRRRGVPFRLGLACRPLIPAADRPRPPCP